MNRERRERLPRGRQEISVSPFPKTQIIIVGTAEYNGVKKKKTIASKANLHDLWHREKEYKSRSQNKTALWYQQAFKQRAEGGHRTRQPVPCWEGWQHYREQHPHC